MISHDRLSGMRTSSSHCAYCAKRQTKGRGRGENAWWSDDGSLTFTLAIDPERHGLRLEHQPRIALATAVAIIRTLPAAAIGIRWPNDLEWTGRKLGGILPERIETRFGSRVLIGIGLNLETDLDRAPIEVRRMAVSLREIFGTTRIVTDDLFVHVLRQVGRGLEQLAGNDERLPRRWSELDILRDEVIRIDLGTRIIQGVANGIDGEGALVVDVEGESIQLFGGRVLRDT